MNRFSISQLEHYSGIKAHTIRIWEQRYDALQPCRTDGNTRYYDGNQLRRLLNIVTLTQAGVKISTACKMDDNTLFSRVQDVGLRKNEEKLTFSTYINQLIKTSLLYDEAGFGKIYNSCIKQYGYIETYVYIIMPLLQRLGLLWSTGELSPANEHFISNLIRQKIIAAIDKITIPVNEKLGTWLLFTPQNELHEIGLLIAQLLLRQQGINSYYLGINVPLQSLLDMLDVKPYNIFLYVTNTGVQGEVADYLKALCLHTHTKEIVIAGNITHTNPIQGGTSKTLSNKLTTINSIDSLSHYLQNKMGI